MEECGKTWYDVVLSRVVRVERHGVEGSGVGW